MADSVVPIRQGSVVIKTGGPNAEVIETCRELLDRAERGEIVGIGYYVIDPTGGNLTNWVGGESDCQQAIVAVTRLYRRLLKAIWPDD